MLRINEIFPTLQGEAYWTGTPATFIRLQGCPVGCSWCDTKHTWPKGSPSKKRSNKDIVAKENSSPTWTDFLVSDIVDTVCNYQPTHFVITGGEPCAQNIKPLTEALLRVGTVQIETSGTHEIDVSPGTWVTVSPKVGMSGGFNVLDQALFRADEIKMPVEHQTDIDNLLPLVPHLQRNALIWLQPISQGDAATALCLKQCMEKNWRLSIQTHKYAGVR